MNFFMLGSQVETQLKNLFEFDPKESLKISAKSGLNVEGLLDAIVERIPPPTTNRNAPFRYVQWNLFLVLLSCLSHLSSFVVATGRIISVLSLRMYYLDHRDFDFNWSYWKRHFFTHSLHFFPPISFLLLFYFSCSRNVGVDVVFVKLFKVVRFSSSVHFSALFLSRLIPVRKFSTRFSIIFVVL